MTDNYKNECSKNEDKIENETYCFEGVEFKPTKFSDGLMLKTEEIESRKREFKGFGKPMNKSKLVTDDDWKRYKHQIPELKMQIAAMLNTEGGDIFLGVAPNGVIKGGDYTSQDKEKLLCFLKNLAKEFKINGQGFLDEPIFYPIPARYVKMFPNEPNSTRYLVILKIRPANTPIFNNTGKIYVRDLGGVEEIDYKTWYGKKIREHGVQDKLDVPKQRNLTYAQALTLNT